MSEEAPRVQRLPLARVKHIMKLDPAATNVSSEASMLVALATEMFVESLARECYTFTVANKKKTMSKADVDTAMEATPALAFLDGALD